MNSPAFGDYCVLVFVHIENDAVVVCCYTYISSTRGTRPQWRNDNPVENTSNSLSSRWKRMTGNPHNIKKKKK
jgi:hypothetical protein